MRAVAARLSVRSAKDLQQYSALVHIIYEPAQNIAQPKLSA
jgi:hypothetical protein